MHEAGNPEAGALGQPRETGLGGVRGGFRTGGHMYTVADLY